MIFLLGISTLSHLHKDIQRGLHRPDRETIGRNSMRARGRNGGPLKDRAVRDLRAAGKSNMK